MKKSGTVSLRKRMLVMLMVGVFLLGAMLCRVGWIQAIHGEEYSKRAALQQTKDVVISSKRGTIYDRNMSELAISASSDTVTVSPKDIAESGDINEISSGLASILGMDKDDVYSVLAKKTSYEVLKRRIDKDQADAIRAKNYVGVSLVEDFKRYYPGEDLAAHIIGFVGNDNQGLSGIEMVYDDYLKGLPGRLITTQNATGTEMPRKYEKYIDPENGVNVVLTIDEFIQRKAEDCLKKWSEDYIVENGAACIIMGAKTGEILAMATYPGFNLNEPFTIMDEELKEEIDEIDDDKKRQRATSDALNKQWRNKAVVDSYEPGSTFKAMVAAMALEENLVGLNEGFNCQGGVQVANYNIKCWNTYGHGAETFVQGVYNSCNPVFMSVGARLGTSNFYKYYKAFGFGATTGFDLPGEALGTFHAMKNFNEVELATASFGQGFTVTPLQLVTAYSAIANNGNMLKPRIIKSLVDDNGEVIREYEPEVIRQVVSEETADTVCEILEGVASDGTSKNAYIEGYKVAGKTGTSEKIPRGNGKYVASFVGFAPADDPEYICLVMLDEPMGGSHMGGAVAAPLFKEVMSDVFVYMQMPSESDKVYNTVPNVSGLNIAKAKSAITEMGLQYVIKGNGDSVLKQSPAAGTALGEGAIVVVYTEEADPDYVEIPDVVGMNASDVNAVLINSGLNMKVRGAEDIGEGVVVGRQSPRAGTKVARGSVVTVEYNYTNSVH